MSKTVRNIQRVFIGGNPAAVTTSNLTSTFVANTGELGIFTPEGIRLVQGSGSTGALNAANKQFIIAQSRGASGEPKLLVSDVIDKSKIVSATVKNYTAATEQVDYIGYNGSTGSIEVNANELYFIEILLEEFITSEHDGRYIKHGQYNSNSTSTQETIAFELTKSLINNFSREPKPLIRFERVNNAAATNTDLAALGTPTGDLSVVYGSQYITVASSTASLTVGDYVRFSASATEALTDSAYEITEITSATVFKIDVPYQGTTNSAYDDAFVHLIPSASVGANFGLKLTGIAQPWSLERKFYKKVRWTTNLVNDDSFGATAVTKSVGATEGSGEYRQVAELERFFQRNDNDNYRIGEPNLFSPRNDADSAVLGSGYDLIQIVYNQVENVGFVDNVSPKVLTLCIPHAGLSSATSPIYSIASTANDITDVLEELVYNVAANASLSLG